MKTEVYIRCDGSSTIGLGHLVRCIALAHMLKNDFKVIFFCIEIPDALQQEIIFSGIEIRMLKDEEEFFQHINNSIIVVLDGYQYDVEYQQRIKTTKAQLVFIDDLHEGEFFADLIINQVPNVAAGNYQAQPFTHFALGPEYVLLRKPFLEAASKNRTQTESASVLICFGGADPKNFTERVLAVALKDKGFKKIEVVIGQAYAYQKELILTAASDPRVSISKGLTDQQMAALFVQTQIAIVPSSGILMEAIATQSNVISGFYVDNQKLVYEAYKSSFIDAGNFSIIETEKAITVALTNPPLTRIKIDGQSGNRLVKRFRQLAEAIHITVRKATESDLDITFKWASSPAVRAFSFQQHEIKREEHEAWYNRKLQDIKCVYFLVQWKNEIIGSIRYDVQDAQALISYLVDPQHHSRGFGLILLAQSFQPLLNELKERKLVIRQIVGYVMKDNYPSRKTFVNLGFTELEENEKLKFVKQLT